MPDAALIGRCLDEDRILLTRDLTMHPIYHLLFNGS
jgi:hypothetical protein